MSLPKVILLQSQETMLQIIKKVVKKKKSVSLAA